MKMKNKHALNDNYDKLINHGGTKLDLNCKIDTKKALLTWADSMILFFLYNKDDTWKSTERGIYFLIVSFEGDVRNWWEEISNDTKTLIKRRGIIINDLLLFIFDKMSIIPLMK